MAPIPPNPALASPPNPALPSTTPQPPLPQPLTACSRAASASPASVAALLQAVSGDQTLCDNTHRPPAKAVAISTLRPAGLTSRCPSPG